MFFKKSCNFCIFFIKKYGKLNKKHSKKTQKSRNKAVVKKIVFLLIISFCGIVFLSEPEKKHPLPLYFTPPAVIKHFTFGYKEQVADFLWLRFLQSADFCSFEKGLPSYNGEALTCKYGWSYHITNTITELAPRFKTVYKTAGVLMSVFTGDQKGAERILLKGIKHFPNDAQINFYLSYFYSVEKPKPQLATHYATMSAKNGGPLWLYNYSSIPSHKAKALEHAVLKGLLQGNLTPLQKTIIRKRLKKQSLEQKIR